MNKIKASVKAIVRKDVGAFCSLKECIIVERLPKTRSGKILRGTIRKIVNNQEFVFPATIDDPTILDNIKQVTADWKATLTDAQK